MATNQQILDHSREIAEFVKRILAAVAGVGRDVANLKTRLTAIENSPGVLSPEDQVSLDGARADVKSATEQIEALDALAEDAPDPPA